MSSVTNKLIFNLIKYRDPGLPTYTYFWVKDEESDKSISDEFKSNRIVSHFFNSEEEAINWINESLNKARK